MMKVFSVKLEEMSIILFIGIIAAGIFFTEQRGKESVPTMMPTMSKTIVIDAGHGGWGPWRYSRTLDKKLGISYSY